MELFLFFVPCLLLLLLSSFCFQLFFIFSLLLALVFPPQLEVVGDLGMGPGVLTKYYKNRGFRVLWHPKNDEILVQKV